MTDKGTVPLLGLGNSRQFVIVEDGVERPV